MKVSTEAEEKPKADKKEAPKEDKKEDKPKEDKPKADKKEKPKEDKLIGSLASAIGKSNIGSLASAIGKSNAATTKTNRTVNTNDKETNTTAFWLIALFFLFLDVFMGRYSTSFSNFGLWFAFSLVYVFLGVVWVISMKKPVKEGVQLSAIGFFWPLLALIGDFFPNSRYFGMMLGFVMYFCHPYVLRFVAEHPRISLFYFLFLIVCIYSFYLEDVQELAGARGIRLNTPSFKVVFSYYIEKSGELISFIGTQLASSYTNSIRLATGEGMERVEGEEEEVKVDLGVAVRDVKSELKRPKEGEDLLITGLIDAKTIDLPLAITVACTAFSKTDDSTVAVREIPGTLADDTFSLEPEDEVQESIECIVPGEDVDADFDRVEIKTGFAFTTTTTLKNDFIGKQLARQVKKEKKPLSEYGIVHTDGKASFTSGPVGIGIKTVTAQPISVDPEKNILGLPLQMTIENIGAQRRLIGQGKGSVDSVSRLYVLLSKPFTLSRFSAIQNPSAAEGIAQVTCAGFPHQACEDDITNVYDISKAALDTYAGEYEQGFVTMNMRVEAPTDTILGTNAVATHTFSVFAEYDYSITTKVKVDVEKKKEEKV
jgi:hypothetical protein